MSDKPLKQNWNTKEMCVRNYFDKELGNGNGFCLVSTFKSEELAE